MKMIAKREFLGLMAALGSMVGILWMAVTLSSTGIPNTSVTRLGLVAVVTSVALVVGLKLLYRKGKTPREQFITIFTLVFFTSFSLGSLLFSLPKAPTSDPDKLVLYYKAEILGLRGDIEARGSSSTLDADLRQRSLQLADLIGEIDGGQLRMANRIIQHEYRGWAFLMGVSSYGEIPPEYITTASRIDYATKAVAEFDLALSLMAEVTRDHMAGDPAATPIYEWITGPSEDVNRTHYLKAIALAVIARASGGPPKAAIAELSAIERSYLLDFPPENNPDLEWALTGEARGSNYTNGGSDPPL